MTVSQLLKQRVRYAPYLERVKEAHELVPLFRHGQYLGWSGFTGVGTPKCVPEAIVNHVIQNNLQGKLKFNLFVGASAGPEEELWAIHDLIIKRAPHQVGKPIAKAINTGKIKFFDKHLSMFPQDLTYGFYTRDRTDGKILDYMIIEATAIKEDGSIVPGPSVGGSPEFISVSDKVIIEVNTATPSFEGIHDIDLPVLPPYRTPYPYVKVDDKCGRDSIPVDPNRVIAIVESTTRDKVPQNTPSDDTSQAIASHLVEFFRNEVNHGRLPENLLPLQSGIGNIANAVIEGLTDANFKHLNVWTEVLQDSFLNLFENGSLDFATATSIRLTEAGFKRVFSDWDKFKTKICLRSQVVSNSPEIIRRLGVIAMNTPVEVDIYGHANSTNVSGSRMLNGLGGSADFLRNAKLSIMHCPSARPTKTDPTGISSIVPMVSHVDQTEHDLDVIVTEQGLADLRGLCPRDRAHEIIKQCAHPDYKDLLTEYLHKAEHYAAHHNCLHEPHMLQNAFKFHTNLQAKGTMKVSEWDLVE